MKTFFSNSFSCIIALLGQTVFICLTGDAQSCTDTNYNFTLSANRQFNIKHQITTQSGNVIYCGEIYSGAQSAALLFCLDRQGTPLWTRSFTNEQLPATLFEKITELANGDFIVTGKSFDGDKAEYMIVARFNAIGVLLWYHFYKGDVFTLNSGSSVWPRTIIEDNPGNIYFSFYLGTRNFSAIAKLDANGRLDWSRSFTYTKDSLNSFYSIAFLPAFVRDDTLCITGAGSWDYYAMKLNRHTGSLISLNRYPLSSAFPSLGLETQQVVNIFPLANGHFISVTRLIWSAPAEYFFSEWDQNLNMVRSFVANQGSVPMDVLSSILILPDGEIQYITPFAGNANYWKNLNSFYFAAFDSANNSIFQKKVSLARSDYAYGISSGRSLISEGDKGNIRLTPVYAGSSGYGMDCYYFNPVNDFTGQCIISRDTNFVSLTDVQIKKIPFSFDDIQDNALEEVPYTLVISDELFLKQTVCEKISACNQLTIKGSSEICLTKMPVEFIVSKNEKCLQKVNWQIDRSAIDSLKQVNDSTIHLYFNKEWRGKLYVSLDGCSLKDSLSIFVKKFYTKQLLGSDTTICIGDSIRLSAPDIYSSYVWNNSPETNHTLMVKNVGIYSLMAQRPDGCFDFDTVLVSHYPSAAFSLSKNNILCSGQSDTLNPGKNFTSYIWQDGSNDSKIIVREPGVYWVKVTDQYGCQWSDSVNILTIQFPPTRFIDTGFSICQPGTVLLHPNTTFSSYLWSTGNNLPSLEVDRPGNYSLIVTDSNGCKGKQDISVRPMFCPNNLYFPTAFTPNGDGKNDLFRPHIDGVLIKYQLQIFNRWGQMVFTSTDPLSGWTGKYLSAFQPQGVYVWQVMYEFTGQSLQYKKGTVVLIR